MLSALWEDIEIAWDWTYLHFGCEYFCGTLKDLWLKKNDSGFTARIAKARLSFFSSLICNSFEVLFLSVLYTLVGVRLCGQRLTSFRPCEYLMILSRGSFCELILLSQGGREEWSGEEGAERRWGEVTFLLAQTSACKSLSVILIFVFSTDHLDALLRYLKEQSLAHQKFVWVLNISRNGYKKLSLNRSVMISSEVSPLFRILFIVFVYSFTVLFLWSVKASNQERF